MIKIQIYKELILSGNKSKALKLLRGPIKQLTKDDKPLLHKLSGLIILKDLKTM